MLAFLTYTLVCFGSLFSIVDPFAALPIFLALAGDQPRAAQHGTALRASLTCCIVLTTFGVFGTYIFTFFSITIPAFKIAGGILLFGVGLEMMRAKHSHTRTTHEEEAEAETRDDVGLIPLGLPLLAGPGAIATVMVLIGKARSVPQRMSVYTAILAVSLITFLVLRSAALVARALGTTGINLIGRIMGLILAASSMQFVIDGIQEAFPKLLGEHVVGVASVVETLTRAARHMT
jgi:multiple antibiotic resistance protein